MLVSHSLIFSDYGTSFNKKLVLGGSLGVFLFFTLTGYLLYSPFARRAFGDGRPIDLVRYARNRAVRILPLYYVVLVVILLVNEHGGTFTQWWRFATFTQSFFKDTVSTVDGPMWSLVVEVQFYVLLPFLAAGIAYLARGSRVRAAALIGLLAAASLAVWWFEVHELHGQDSRWLYSLPATFFNFTTGMLLALVRVATIERRPRWMPSSTMLLASGVACWVIAAENLRVAQVVVALASFLIVGAVVLGTADGPLVRVLDLRPLAIVGIASYSLYLWHYPIAHGIHKQFRSGGFPELVAIALPVCVAVALLSYRVVERPFLTLRTRWGSTTAVADEPDPATPPATRPRGCLPNGWPR